MQIEDKVLLSVAGILGNLEVLRFSYVLDASVLISLTNETCLATGAKCSKCKKKGHFAVVCPSVVGEVTHTPQETNQHFFLGAIKSGDSGKEP